MCRQGRTGEQTSVLQTLIAFLSSSRSQGPTSARILLPLRSLPRSLSWSSSCMSRPAPPRYPAALLLLLPSNVNVHD